MTLEAVDGPHGGQQRHPLGGGCPQKVLSGVQLPLGLPYSFFRCRDLRGGLPGPGQAFLCGALTTQCVVVGPLRFVQLDRISFGCCGGGF